MTDSATQHKPEWMENWTPDNGEGSPKWKKGMPSPNPKGRPKGIVDKRQRVSKLLADDADKVVRVVIDSALKGDVQAASLVLARIAPVLRAQAEKVKFEFDATAPMTEQVQAVLQGISEGNVSPDVGKQIIESISALAGIKQIDELEQRLSALEGR